jgi:hypothetical protein
MTLNQYQKGMNRLTAIRNNLTTARQALEAEKDSTRWPVLEAAVWGFEQEMREVEAEMNKLQK